MTEQQLIIRAWRLDTSAIACMRLACHRVAQAVVNVWVSKREWLVVFLCTACLFRAKQDVKVLQVFLGEKRVHEREMVELEKAGRRKRGQVA